MENVYILGDFGSSNLRLRVIDGNLEKLAEEDFVLNGNGSIGDVLGSFSRNSGIEGVKATVLAVAGPIDIATNSVTLTNCKSMVINANELNGFGKVHLVNDHAAIGWAMLGIKENDAVLISNGSTRETYFTEVGLGSGLGGCVSFKNQHGKIEVRKAEPGHNLWTPNPKNSLEMALHGYLGKLYGSDKEVFSGIPHLEERKQPNPVYEDVASARGLANFARAILDDNFKGVEEIERIRKYDNVMNRLRGVDKKDYRALCIEIRRIFQGENNEHDSPKRIEEYSTLLMPFFDITTRATAQCLRTLANSHAAYGPMYITGGVGKRLLPFFIYRADMLREELCNVTTPFVVERMQNMPIYVMTNDKIALDGLAMYVSQEILKR